MSTRADHGDVGAGPPFTPSSAGPGAARPADAAAPRFATDRRFATPRRVRHGLKLRAKPPLAFKSTVAQQWIKLIENLCSPSRMTEGTEYARLGQTVSLSIGDEQSGVISAKVQGTSSRPYLTKIQFGTFDAAQWESVVQAMSHEALYVAKLLANEWPASIDDLFKGIGLELLPASIERHKLECDCRDDEPCKHAAAIGLLVAEHFEREPLSIFLLRGLPVEKLIDRIRHARAIHASEAATNGNAHAEAGAPAHAPEGQGVQGLSNGSSGRTKDSRPPGPTHDPMIPESQVEPPPLEQCLDEFWRAGPRLAELESRPPRQHIPHALLRRLGPSPLNGKFPLVGLLASIYDATAAAARNLQQKSTAEDRSTEPLNDTGPYNSSSDADR